MYIHEAVKKAMKVKGMIFRRSMKIPESELFNVIKPSNSYETCQLVISRYGKAERAERAWNPTADDLIADDWELTERPPQKEWSQDRRKTTNRVNIEFKDGMVIISRPGNLD